MNKIPVNLLSANVDTQRETSQQGHIKVFYLFLFILKSIANRDLPPLLTETS